MSQQSEDENVHLKVCQNCYGEFSYHTHFDMGYCMPCSKALFEEMKGEDGATCHCCNTYYSMYDKIRCVSRCNDCTELYCDDCTHNGLSSKSDDRCCCCDKKQARREKLRKKKKVINDLIKIIRYARKIGVV